MTMEIRAACAEDAEAICELQRVSLKRLGAGAYAADVLEAWAAGLSPEGYVRAMRAGESIWVATDRGDVIGFGSILVAASEVRSLYLHPDYVRRGIGAKLLGELESRLAEAGATTAQLASTLMAVDFYQAHGYRRGQTGLHTRCGAQLACIRMCKPLTPR